MLGEAKLHKIEQLDDVSHASEYLLDEVSQTRSDDDTQWNRVEPLVNRSISHCEQTLLGGDTEAEEETRTGLTASDN